MGIFTPCKKLWSFRIYPTLEKGFILFLQKNPPVHVLICQNKLKKLVPNGTTAAASHMQKQQHALPHTLGLCNTAHKHTQTQSVECG